MTKRLASAFVGLPILLGAVWLGSFWFAGIVFAAAAIATIELARLSNLWGDKLHPAIPLVVTMVLLISGLSRALGENQMGYGFFLDIAAVGVCPLAGWVLGSGRKLPVVDSPPAMLLRIGVYLGLSLYYALQIRFLEDGRE